MYGSAVKTDTADMAVKCLWAKVFLGLLGRMSVFYLPIFNLHEVKDSETDIHWLPKVGARRCSPLAEKISH
jgi:hypothetical protein